jgi:Ni,Fe-hydrogenase III large subunit
MIRKNLQEVAARYRDIEERIFSLPSVLGRFEGIGKVTTMQASLCGAVGMAARSSGMYRDIRWSHPFAAFRETPYLPVILPGGDVHARAILRKFEIEKSTALIETLLNRYQSESNAPVSFSLPKPHLKPGSLGFAMTEGWRGEILHIAVTDETGKMILYKIKDPSFHNWMALALAVRNQEISDFPLCNKSFNLSYCGNDL